MKFTKFSIENYKCFTNETIFERPSLVNLIIGRNNSGKSSFLDVISNIYCSNRINTPHIERFFFEIDSSDLDSIVAIYDPLPGGPAYAPPLNKTKLIGKEIKMSFEKNGTKLDQNSKYFEDNGFRYGLSFPNAKGNYLGIRGSKKVFIKAERNVTSESGNYLSEVTEGGEGLTSNFKYHFSHSKGSRALIKSILDELNNILAGEERFTDLRILDEDDVYTIYLETKNKEISLNDMGSGIKTLLFVLFTLKHEEAFPKDTLFMFEELENNLHPEIQRRLFNLIYDFAVKNKKRVFITSHSHVAINCFYGKAQTRIYHIEKSKEGSSSIQTVNSDLAKGIILDDLGVKASDLFQTNGIVWVEGPSDRVYINKWLGIVAPELKEGSDYTYLFYGGRLLSHYSVDQEDDMISILLTNRNSAIVIDSDIKNKGQTINQTKTRIQKSFTENNMFCWVTKGREIENYISKDVANNRYRKDAKEKLPQIGIYEDFKDYIGNDDSQFESHKVLTSKELEFDNESLDILDLRDKITQLADTIRKWNNNLY